MKRFLGLLLGGMAGLAASQQASATAGLLGVELLKPYTVYDSTGVTTYNHSTDLLTANATLLASQFDGVSVLLPLGSATISMNVKVNSYGRVTGGVSGPDLLMTGTIDVNGDGVPEYTGTLLTGEVQSFGSLEAGATDQFDLVFSVTGGSMAGLYAKKVGVTLTVENSTFTGSFCQNFSGGAKGTVGNQDGDDCPHNPWYWKNSCYSWPRSTLSLGGTDYNWSQLYNLLRGKLPNGSWCGDDATVSLASYLIAAKLSLLSGAVVDEDIIEAISLADAFLSTHSFGADLTDEEADLASALQETLSAYVNTTTNCGGTGCHWGGGDHNRCHRYRGHGGWRCR